MALRFSLDAQRTEVAAGAAVAMAAVIGLILANTPEAARYFALTGTDFSVQIGAFTETMSRQAWIRQGLMAIFFFQVGLELKQEALRGELSSPRRLALPALAALGGLIGPALAYLALNLGPGGVPRGWPIAIAADGACAFAVLAMVGRGLPQALRVFLQASLVTGQLGAAIVVAVLYRSEIHMWPLAGAMLALMGLIALSEWRAAPFLFRLVGYIALWAFLLKAGLEPAVGGFAAALTVPGTGRRPGHEMALRDYHRALKPYVDFGVLPLFVLTAAGVSLRGGGVSQILAPVPLGLLAALLLGKPVGMLIAIFAGVRSGLARRPTGASWLELWGLSALSGCGLGLGLFLTGLAFPREDPVSTGATAAVLLGCLNAAAIGGGLLNLAAAQRRRLRPEIEEEAA